MRILRSSLFVAAIAIIAAACYEPPREEPARIVYVPIYEYRQESCFVLVGIIHAGYENERAIIVTHSQELFIQFHHE